MPIPYTEDMTQRGSSARRFPYGIVLGVSAGIGLGVVLQSLVIGIAVGSGLAFLLGTAVEIRRRQHESDA